jgi:hypothetical protein
MPITDINEFFRFFDDLSDEEFNQMLDECAPPIDADATNLVYAEDYIVFMKAQQRYNAICSDKITATPNKKTQSNLTQQLYQQTDEYALAA